MATSTDPLVAVHVRGFSADEAVAVETMRAPLVLASLELYLDHGSEGDLLYDEFADASLRRPGVARLNGAEHPRPQSGTPTPVS
jgi:hypothetical protein